MEIELDFIKLQTRLTLESSIKICTLCFVGNEGSDFITLLFSTKLMSSLSSEIDIIIELYSDLNLELHKKVVQSIGYWTIRLVGNEVLNTTASL